MCSNELIQCQKFEILLLYLSPSVLCFNKEIGGYRFGIFVLSSNSSLTPQTFYLLTIIAVFLKGPKRHMPVPLVRLPKLSLVVIQMKENSKSVTLENTHSV